MPVKKKAEAVAEVIIPPIDIRTVTIKVVGDSPLIVHKWSEKAKKEILDKQMKVAKTKGHEAKSPVADFIQSLYWIEGEPQELTEAGFAQAIQNGARFGFPSVAFKAAAVAAGFRSGITPNKVGMYAAFHIDKELLEIHGTPSMREDMVKVGMGTADIRYRGEFPEWWAIIPVHFNAGVISLSQLTNLFNLGGFACGVGEWRVEKGGEFGRFHVE